MDAQQFCGILLADLLQTVGNLLYGLCSTFTLVGPTVDNWLVALNRLTGLHAQARWTRCSRLFEQLTADDRDAPVSLHPEVRTSACYIRELNDNVAIDRDIIIGL